MYNRIVSLFQMDVMSLTRGIWILLGETHSCPWETLIPCHKEKVMV